MTERTCKECREAGYKTVCEAAYLAWRGMVCDGETRQMPDCARAFAFGAPVAHKHKEQEG